MRLPGLGSDGVSIDVSHRCHIIQAEIPGTLASYWQILNDARSLPNICRFCVLLVPRSVLDVGG
eukprot:6174303-Pleurochrysis_carterae.AAC.1